MAPTAITLGRQWRQTHAYSHGWLVLPMLLYALGWHWRQPVRETHLRPCTAGIAVTGGAAVLWVAAELMNIEIGRQVALVFMVLGVVLAALGATFIRRWWPALGLLVFLLPSADLLQPALRWGTAEALDFTLRALGLEVQRNGFLLSLGTNRYFVADGCSGLAYVTLLAFLGYAFGVLMYRSFWRVVGLALAAGVFGALCNLVRVNAIVLLDYWRGSQMDLMSHGYVQWISLLSAIGVMLFVVARSQVDLTTSGDTERTRADDRHTIGTPWCRAAAPWAGLVGTVIATLGVVIPPNAAAVNAPALRPDALPSHLRGWALMEHPQTPEGAVGVPSHLSWRYAKGTRYLQLDILQAGHREKLSEFGAASPRPEGWHDIQRRTLSTCSTDRCAGVIHQVWERSASTSLRHTYSTFVVDGEMTASQLLLRAQIGWAALTGNAVNPRLITMTVDGEAMPLQEVHAILFAAAEYRSISRE